MIEVDLPGCSAETIAVSVTPDKLRIEAGRRGYLLSKELTSRTKRVEYRLDGVYDLGGVTAIYADGVLSVRLPIRDLKLDAQRIVPVTAG